jgi:hypothetical protein
MVCFYDFVITLMKKKLNRFMENVAFDLPQHYPPVPIPPFAKGEVSDISLSKILINV